MYPMATNSIHARRRPTGLIRPEFLVSGSSDRMRRCVLESGVHVRIRTCVSSENWPCFMKVPWGTTPGMLPVTMQLLEMFIMFSILHHTFGRKKIRAHQVLPTCSSVCTSWKHATNTHTTCKTIIIICNMCMLQLWTHPHSFCWIRP
jgi:hypothetical protein